MKYMAGLSCHGRHVPGGIMSGSGSASLSIPLTFTSQSSRTLWISSRLFSYVTSSTSLARLKIYKSAASASLLSFLDTLLGTNDSL